MFADQPVAAPRAGSGERAVASSGTEWNALARLQGVRESTIRSYVPGLSINSQVIELERTEPVAHSSGGVVGVLSPYLRAHVTRSLVARGQANYSDHYSGLRRLEARYGVDPSVLMSIWGMETSYGTVTGSTDLLNALASLGFREELFQHVEIFVLRDREDLGAAPIVFLIERIERRDLGAAGWTPGRPVDDQHRLADQFTRQIALAINIGERLAL